MTRTIPLRLAFDEVFDLEPKVFFEDQDEHVDATDEECAEEVRSYIEEFGMERFLRDWNLNGGERGTPWEITVGNMKVFS